MRADFVVPVLFPTFNTLHTYLNYIPDTCHPTRFDSVDFSQYRRAGFQVSFAVVGCTYLINLDFAFSVWFFNTATNLIRRGLGILGVASSRKLGIYGAQGTPIFAHQGQGATIILVLFGQWGGREHLGRACVPQGVHGGR